MKICGDGVKTSRILLHKEVAQATDDLQAHLLCSKRIPINKRISTYCKDTSYLGQIKIIVDNDCSDGGQKAVQHVNTHTPDEDS